MDPEFWLQRWRGNQIGFHRTDTNPLLATYWHQLGITKGAAVFVPLCGKSLDMRYLEAEGHTVFGVELSEDAILAYFDEADEPWERTEGFYLRRYAGAHSALYCGDFFDLHTPDIVGIRAVYDRGALVALPEGVRWKYVDHLLRIIPEHAHILLLTLEYDQSKVDGPPFSVSQEEVTALYSSRARVQVLGDAQTTELPPKFSAAGLNSVREVVYHIVKEH